MVAKYHGHILLAGPDKGTGKIVDEWGWSIQLAGVKTDINGVPALALTGVVSELPESLKSTLLDATKLELG